MTNPQGDEWTSPFDTLLDADADTAAAQTVPIIGTPSRITCESPLDSEEPDKASTNACDAGNQGPTSSSQNDAVPPKSTSRSRLGLHRDGQQSDTSLFLSTKSILKQFNGTDIPVDALVQQAIDYGWPTLEQDTAPEYAGLLLEANGVPVNHHQDANLFHLANELAQGHKVVVGIDSQGLWDGHPIRSQIADRVDKSGADYGLVVCGIDTSDPDRVKIIVNDPVTGEIAASYPLETFVDAWRDTDFSMVATREFAPPDSPEMAHFDYEAGHLPALWGMSYPSFAALEHRPEQ